MATFDERFSPLDELRYRPSQSEMLAQLKRRAPRSDLPVIGPPMVDIGGDPSADRREADTWFDLAVPQSPSDFALMAIGGPLSRLGKLAALGGGFALDSDEAQAGKLKALKSLMASPEEINRVASETLKGGVTQPQLRRTYEELGLTGAPPSELAQRSLSQQQPQELIDQTVALKLADRDVIRTLKGDEAKHFQKTGELPGGALLPSQEAQLPGMEAFKPVKKEVAKAEKAFDAATARGGRNTDLFDLSAETLRQTPDVPQFNLPRIAPEMTERLASVPGGGLRRLESAAGKAPEENWGWYNLMQARDMFHKIHGKGQGEQAWNAWLDGMAGTSMVNPIDNNTRSSTWYLQQLLSGKPLPQIVQLQDPVTGKSVKTMVGGPPPGYGAKSQVQHAERVKDYLTHSYDPVSNPKPISYRMNLSGNWMPRTVDTHDIRNAVGMPRALDLFGENAGLLPKEYSYLEGLGQRAANRAGSSQAAQQAATWIGGGDYTGLKSHPAPLLEVLNRRAHVTGMVRGQDPYQALLDAFRTGGQPLL